MSLVNETQPLRGTNILVIEDEAILALDLALTIEDEGASVEGPMHRLDEAMALSDLRSLDAALLDVDIYGREIFAFADRLREHDIPIVFHTGRSDLTRLSARYPEAPIVRKPSPTRTVVKSLTDAVRRFGAARKEGVAAAS